MALLGFEGFDNWAGVGDLLVMPGWRTASISGGITMQAGLLGGLALQPQITLPTIVYTPIAGGNHTTFIWGGRVYTGSAFASGGMMQFKDGTSTQCGLSVTAGGILQLYRGTFPGTVIASSPTALVLNSWYDFELKVLFNSSGTYEIHRDGVLDFSGSANTIATANPSATCVQLDTWQSAAIRHDDFYLCNDTGGAPYNNFLGVCRVETLYANSISSTQSTPLTNDISIMVTQAGVENQPANTIYYSPWIPTTGGTLYSIITRSWDQPSFNGALNLAFFADNANTPGGLIAVANSQILYALGNNSVTGPDLQFSFTPPVTIVPNTRYWIGVMCDTAWHPAGSNGISGCYNQARTYSQGFPSLPSGLSSSATGSSNITQHYLRAVTNAVNVTMINEVQENGDTTYLSLTGQGFDLYGHGSLSSTPTTVYGVDILSMVRKDDTTPITVRNKLQSAATIANGANFSPATAYQWMRDSYINDPATGVAWTGAGVNVSLLGWERTTAGYWLDTVSFIGPTAQFNLSARYQ